MPPELDAVRLALPESDDPSPGMIDGSGNPVAHVYGSYPETPDEQDAILEFAVPWRGLRIQAAFAAAFTGAVFLSVLLLPNALTTLLSAGGGAAALLLAAPGALMAVRAGAQENVVASQVLGPLRMVMYGCALLLTAAAASIVGQLQNPWITTLWVCGASLVVATFMMLMWVRAGVWVVAGRKAVSGWTRQEVAP